MDPVQTWNMFYSLTLVWNSLFLIWRLENQIKCQDVQPDIQYGNINGSKAGVVKYIVLTSQKRSTEHWETFIVCHVSTSHKCYLYRNKATLQNKF